MTTPRVVPLECSAAESSTQDGSGRGESIPSGGNLPPGVLDPGNDCPACGGTTAEHDVTCPCGTGAEAACRGCQRGLGYAVARGTLPPDSCYHCRAVWPDGPFLVSDEAEPGYDPMWDVDPVEPRQSLA